MKKVSILLIGLMLGFAAQAQTTWAFDKTHSNVGFSVTHLVISEVDGQFSTYDGKLVASKADFTDAVIDFEADINEADIAAWTATGARRGVARYKVEKQTEQAMMARLRSREHGGPQND